MDNTRYHEPTSIEDQKVLAQINATGLGIGGATPEIRLWQAVVWRWVADAVGYVAPAQSGNRPDYTRSQLQQSAIASMASEDFDDACVMANVSADQLRRLARDIPDRVYARIEDHYALRISATMSWYQTANYRGHYAA